jgi:hypothetical protein
MQYILTEEEYNTLLNSGKIRKKEDQDTINRLCQMVADNKLVTVHWSKEIAPWGCIHTRGKDNWYCDECPVKKMCGLPKNWSK